MTRVALLHPKGIDGPELAQLKLTVSQALASAGYNDTRLITGKEDWERTFKTCGSWGEWERQVAVGVDPVTQEPRYHLFIVAPGRQIGAATKGILEHALSNRKACAFWDGERFLRVRAVTVLDNRDFKRGFEVTV